MIRPRWLRWFFASIDNPRQSLTLSIQTHRVSSAIKCSAFALPMTTIQKAH